MIAAAEKFDNAIVAAYETMLHNAGYGAVTRQKRLFNTFAVQMMHLKADDEQHGMGINSLLHIVKSGAWIAGLRASRNLDKNTQSPHQKRVNAYVDKHVGGKVQGIIDKAASITTPEYRTFFTHAIPTDAVTFLNGKQPAKAVRKRLRKVYNDNNFKHNCHNQHNHYNFNDYNYNNHNLNNNQHVHKYIDHNQYNNHNIHNNAEHA